MSRLALSIVLAAIVFAAVAAVAARAGDAEPATTALDFDLDLDLQSARIDALRGRKARAKAELAPLQKAVDAAHAALTAGRARANEAAEALEARIKEHNARPPLIFIDAEVLAHRRRSRRLAAEQTAAREKSHAERAALLAAFRAAKGRAAPARKRAVELRDRYNARVLAYRKARTRAHDRGVATKSGDGGPTATADAGPPPPRQPLRLP